MSTPTPITVESRLKALEAKACNFITNNWGHFVTWLLVTAGPWVLKHL